MSWRLLPIVLLAVLGAAPAAGSLPPETRRWYRLDARGVTTFTDGDPDRAEEIVRELLAFRLVLESALPGAPPSDGRPVVVHLFESEASFRPYKPVVAGRVSEAAGFFLPRREGAFMASRSGGGQGLRIVRHELVHDHVHRLLGGAPPWLDEGLAEYFAASRVEDGRLVLGEPIAEHLQRLGGSGTLPLDRLLRLPHFESAHAGGDPARQLYAQSWAVVHWLRTGRGDARQLFDRQLAELGRHGSGPLGRDLLLLSGRSAPTLWREVQSHVRAESLPGESLPLSDRATPHHVRRRLDRGEALAALGELLLAVGRVAEAEEHFEASRRARSTWARSWRGLALVRETRGDSAGARAFHEAALERAPRDPEVLLSLARNLLGLCAPDFDPDRVPVEDAVRARELLRRGVGLAPDRAELLAALGLAGLMTTEQADPETGAALEVALEHLPHRGDVAYHLLLWELRRGELARAEALLDGSVLPREAVDSELAVRALNAVTLATVEKAQELAAGGRRAEARSLLEARRDAGLHETMRPQVTRLLRDLR